MPPPAGASPHPQPGPQLLDAGAIAARVDELAAAIAATALDAGHGPLLLVCVLKGSFVFTADLARRLAARGVPVEIEFVAVRSYAGEASAGSVELVCDVATSLRERDVLLVEDVVDTGLTTAFLAEHCGARRPHRLRLAALLDKPGRRRRAVDIDFCGFSIGDEFVVGYGLDVDERWRELPGVHTLAGGTG
ncbi:MAG TPA: hypoxanthine phosphoribosyltransferase [Candidatus Dormibacteraeota bacterium]